jgi:holo-[acyl-carrier protein] synthase
MKAENLEDDNILSKLPISELETLYIVGHSLKIVETRRIAKLMERLGARFETQRFTPTELNVIESNVKRIQYLTGRFATKEAILTVLGQGWSQGISWLDIEVQRMPTGEPSVVLYGNCQKIATKLGIRKWLISISHVSSCAAACAIALGTGSEPVTPKTSVS